MTNLQKVVNQEPTRSRSHISIAGSIEPTAMKFPAKTTRILTDMIYTTRSPIFFFTFSKETKETIIKAKETDKPLHNCIPPDYKSEQGMNCQLYTAEKKINQHINSYICNEATATKTCDTWKKGFTFITRFTTF